MLMAINAFGEDQHFGSHAPYAQKRAVLTACLKKVHKHACDQDALVQSATHKLREFQALMYPSHTLKAACTYMAASLGEPTWFNIRDSVCI